jgi:hypothetical protein
MDGAAQLHTLLTHHGTKLEMLFFFFSFFLLSKLLAPPGQRHGGGAGSDNAEGQQRRAHLHLLICSSAHLLCAI